MQLKNGPMALIHIFFETRHIDIPHTHEKVLNTINHQGNAKQNHTSHLLEQLLSKRHEIRVGEDVEKRELLCSVHGNVNWCSPLWKIIQRFLKTLKMELPHDLAIPLLNIYPKGMKSGSGKDTCTLQHYVHYSIMFATEIRNNLNVYEEIDKDVIHMCVCVYIYGICVYSVYICIYICTCIYVYIYIFV